MLPEPACIYPVGKTLNPVFRDQGFLLISLFVGMSEAVWRSSSDHIGPSILLRCELGPGGAGGVLFR